jgi:hypothetical protein
VVCAAMASTTTCTPHTPRKPKTHTKKKRKTLDTYIIDN